MRPALSLLILATISFQSFSQVVSNPPKVHLTRMFNEVIAHGLPDGWDLAVPRGTTPDGTIQSLTYAPASATAANWTEMIAVTGFKSMAKDPRASPSGMVISLARQQRALCPENTIAVSGGDVMIGQRRANIAVIGCGRLPSDMAGMKAGEGVVSLLVVVAGDNEMFVIRRLQRVAPYEPTSNPITNEIYGRLVRDILPVGVCALDDTPEQCHPKLGSNPNEIYGRRVRDFLPVGVCALDDTPEQCHPKLGGKK